MSLGHNMNTIGRDMKQKINWETITKRHLAGIEKSGYVPEKLYSDIMELPMGATRTALIEKFQGKMTPSDDLLISTVLKNFGKVEKEYRFSDRKFRFDYAFVLRKIAIEINGNAWSTRGGGRHGKSADMQKLNLAQRLGWRVFQYGTSSKEFYRMSVEMNELFNGASLVDYSAYKIEFTN